MRCESESESEELRAQADEEELQHTSCEPEQQTHCIQAIRLTASWERFVVLTLLVSTTLGGILRAYIFAKCLLDLNIPSESTKYYE